MKVRFKKLHPDAVIPKKAHDTDAGFDLTCVETDYSVWYRQLTCKTGLAIEVPKDHVGLIFPRSSIYKTTLHLSNAVGVIDHGYSGEIVFKFRSTARFDESLKCYQKGDRIGQLIILPYPQIEFVEVDELSDSERGQGGFGSSGK